MAVSLVTDQWCGQQLVCGTLWVHLTGRRLRLLPCVVQSTLPLLQQVGACIVPTYTVIQCCDRMQHLLVRYTGTDSIVLPTAATVQSIKPFVMVLCKVVVYGMRFDAFTLMIDLTKY